MDIIDKFKIKRNQIDCFPEELEYIEEYCIKFYPCIDFDDAGIPCICGTSVPSIFSTRYDRKELSCNISIKKYEGDKELPGYIKEFNLDVKKFYYFLLFISDYCYDTTANLLVINKSPIDEVNDFIEAYESDKPMTLTLKVGRKSYPINNLSIINSITKFLQSNLNDWKDIEPLTYRIFDIEVEDAHLHNSITIAYFAKSILQFFNMQPHIVLNRRSGAASSEKELLFISKLVHFIGFSKHESLLTSTELIRSYMKQYKNYKFPTHSKTYMY
ncbi:hypothetical protein AAE250_08360 [Bacteroides sp. GD17]|jgi:hypothetical protein|uniref:hypothetical protein n=1 Tax=Bacteroides sp. GD17 TaxID=3139826 RepID=UPI0025DFE11B|nr:hypothetical protein [uncultured Bacteroides sp.]